jgi:hypothetical protein
MLDINLIFIINGEDVLVPTSLLAPMRAVRIRALQMSHNTGRSPIDWEIRDERGRLLDPNRTVNSYGFVPHERFFLTLGVGIGGALAA